MKIKKLLQSAEQRGVAIGHFNVSNIETFEAAVRASKVMREPIIVAASEGAIRHSGIEFFVGAKEHYGKKYNIEVYLHLDHGRDIKTIEQAIRMGFDSVMVDGSHLPFAANVRMTKKIASLAHRYGVAVEAELGTIGGQEEKVSARKIRYTDPEKVVEFVKKTNCDLLAVAIGTSHGAYKFLGASHLRVDLLRSLNRLVDVPLVLHGASSVPHKLITSIERHGVRVGDPRGVSEKDIRDAIACGIRKINVDTDLQLAMVSSILEGFKKEPKEIKLYKILARARDAMEEEVIRHIKLFSGKQYHDS